MMTDAVLMHERPDVVMLLLERVPSFRSYLDDDDLALPYVVYGFLAQYLLTLPPDSPVVEDAFDLLNYFAESGDPELENLVQAAVFESLVGDERASQLVEGRLRDEAGKLYRAVGRMNEMI